MATGSIRPRRSYAKSQAPTTATATTSAITTDMVINWSQITTGKRAESYIITGSSTNGGTTTTVTAGLTATSVTVPLTSTNSLTSFSFQVTGVNENGLSPSTTSVVYTIPEAWTLDTTMNSSGTYTIPATARKLLILAAGGGTRGGEGTNNGGGGGGGGARIVLWDETVTPGTTYTVTVGAVGNNAAGGNTSMVTPNSATLFSLNGGNAASGGTAGTGGTGTSNASSYVIATGGTGGEGNSGTGTNPDPATSNNPSRIGYLGPTTFDSGGGGGGGRGFNWPGGPSANGAGNPGTGGGSGGTGGNNSPNSQGWFGSQGGAGTSGASATGMGGGGGQGQPGQVIIYTALAPS